MTVFAGSPYPRTCEFLTDIGIDPRDISEHGITTRGYDTFDKSAEGKRVLRDGEIMRTRTEWPNPLVGMTVLTLMQVDRARGLVKA